MNVKIIKDFLTESEFNNFVNFIGSQDFPWYRGYKVYEDDTENMQMRHVFITPEFGRSNMYHVYDQVNRKLDEQGISVVRAKINLTFTSGKKEIGGWHYDFAKEDENIKIGILYINTNNGYTELEDGTKIPSVKNTLAIFDNVEHTDVTHTDTDQRIVLNLGLYLKEEV